MESTKVININTESTVLDGGTTDALRALDVAIALGAEIPAPVKSFVYLASVKVGDEDRVRDDYKVNLGVHQSYESAEVDIVGWILERWSESSKAPWNSDLEFESGDEEYDLGERNYLASKTDVEILEDYFTDHYDSYEIVKLIVKPKVLSFFQA